VEGNLSKSIQPVAWYPRFRLAPSGVAGVAMLAAIVVLVVCPVALMVVQSFHEGPFGRETAWGMANWRAALTDPSLAGALANSVTLSVARLVIGIVISISLAWILARTDIPGSR
jgi:ABC-type Fe3+ transport system permease subunit